MNNVRDFINRLISDEKLLKDIRFWSIIALPFTLAAVYFLFFDNIQLGEVDLIGVGALTLFYFIGMVGLTWETNTSTIEDQLANNEVWKEIETKIKENAPDVKNQRHNLEFILELNQKGQKDANLAITNDEIEKLLTKIGKLQSKGKLKESEKLIKRIDYLSLPENHLWNKDFKPYTYPMIASTDPLGKTTKRKYLDARDVVSNVNKQGRGRIYTSGIFRSIWLGGGFALGVSFELPIVLIIGYVISLLYMQISTIAMVTKSTKEYINTEHIPKRRNKLAHMIDMAKFVIKRISELEKEKVQSNN